MQGFGKRALAAAGVTVISALLGYVGFFLFDVSLLGGSLSKRDSEADVVHFFYSIENQRTDRIDVDPRVVILDVSGCENVAAIAGAIARAAACSPRMIGLDIIFKKTPSVDPAQYDSLSRVMASLPNVVTACRIVPRTDGYSVEHSFYTLPLGIPYGAANGTLGGFRSLYRLENDTLPSLAALLGGGQLPPKRVYTNFKNRHFRTLSATEDSLTEADLGGKTVLVGDVEDLRDFEDMPFRLNGSHRAPGVKVLAYGVSTVLSGDWVRKMPDGWCLLIAFVLNWLFVLGARALNGRKYGSLLTRLGQVALILLLWFGGYWVFSAGGYVINLVYTMVGVGIAGLSMELYDVIFSRKKKS